MHSQFEPEPVHETAHPLLEEYLDRLCDPLERDAPAEEAELARQEMRAHLLLSAAAREELGATPEEALAEAFQRFGDPQLLGRKLAHENNALRSKRALSQGTRILGGLMGGWAALCLAPFFSFLMNLDARLGDVSPPYALQVLLFLLGGRAGWLLASGKGVRVGSPLAALAGSLIGMGTGASLIMFAFHRGWLAVTYPLDGFSTCLHAGLGAAVGWLLWKRPKSLLTSIALGIAAFGLPVLLIALTFACLYPDSRSVHILILHSIIIPIWGAAGGITGAASWLFTRFKAFWERKKVSNAENA